MAYRQSHPDPAQRELIFQATLLSGAPATGLTFSSGDLQIRKPRAFGAAATSSPWVNANAAQQASVVELGSGAYVYTFAQAELDTPGALGFKLSKSSVQLWTVTDEIRQAYLGTVQAGTLTPTSFTGSRAETSANHWANSLLVFITGALTGQVGKIGAYAPGSPSLLTMVAGFAFTGAPSAGDIFEVIDR